MKTLRIYLDTSVINFLFADDAPEKRDNTIEFFNRFVLRKHFESFVSPVVIDEINKTRDLGKRNNLLEVLKTHPIAVLALQPRKEIIDLAEYYIRYKLFPPKKFEDALHVAVCTVHEVDVLVSWNFEHLANINKERKIAALNQGAGYYYPLRITTPLEVMSYD